jgi:putative ABC transport system substrate-binding protein
MHGGKAEDNTEEVAAFEEGLKRSGFTAGQSVSIEYRWAAGRYERLRSIAKEFVERPVTLILAGTPVAAIAAKSESTVVPIVFHIGSDPVRDGLVASLNRPGGNVTGSTFFSNLLTSKRMGLFRELLPQARSIAVLVNPKNANAAFQVSEAQEAARALRLEAIVHRAATSDDIDAVFNTLREQKPDAMLILSDSILNGLAAPIAYAALRNGLPTCFAYREPVLAGGLIGYGANRSESTLRAGVYAGRILKGEKPADLPVQQPTRFDFIINLRTARALGITVPPTLLARADEVIE